MIFTDVCAIEQCLNGGKCQITEHRHTCDCANGYLGENCQYGGIPNKFIIIFPHIKRYVRLQSYFANI